MNAIELDDVTLWRRTQQEFSRDLKRLVFDVLERKYKPVVRRRVLDEVSVTIPRGQKVGIIGPNGAGKSTLLKVICGILKPTSGRVRTNGSIAPLIELGAGFDPEQNLKQNIVYYGVLLGMARHEMRARVERILKFAELEEHAEQPYKTLSSGMAARLGFAVATDVQPEILILDEILSVGDERFRAKCARRIDSFWSADCSVLFVSHDLAMIQRQCQRAIWMKDGAIVADGDPSAVVAQYLGSVRGSVTTAPVAAPA